jgi:hypothetical protein
VQVNVDADSNLLSADQIGEVEGRAALVDLRAGTLVSADLFAAGGLVGPGDGLVGLSLDPGEYPTAALGPGDVVRVVATSVDPAAPGVVVVVEQAVVVDVAAVAGGLDRLFVSLSMPTEQADGVAGAGAEDRVRLIQVGGGR